jgi:RNA polymerase sigma-70 factor (ECF subfamily)
LLLAEEITQLLIKWSDGDRAALDELMPLVYGELRRLANGYLRRHDNNSLQPTALVHEAYLRLVDYQAADWQTRAQFFGLAATIMRNLMVDAARRRQAAKRGGPQYTLSLSEADHLGREQEINLLALDDALQALSALKPRYSRVVELKFFGGLTIEETAAVLGVSHTIVEREWTFARAWLHRELSR